MNLRFGWAALLLLVAGGPAAASPQWIWDQNQNRLDDRIETVEAQGIGAAFENGDPGGRLRFDVTNVNSLFTYGVYVRYDRIPTEADAQSIGALGLPVKRYLYFDFIRSRATLAQIQEILALPGVQRVESLPFMYPVNDNSTRTQGNAGSGGGRFPTVYESQAITGRGVVVGILDSGVNDSADSLTTYPGHESLIGKWVGGGNFSFPDPLLNTGIDESEQAFDRGPETPHASHVTGSAIGSGGPTGMIPGGPYGFYRGMAPDARLVDCKVLTDAGIGGGAPDALEWCIHHRSYDWGLTGPDAIYRGIQVINMSIGGLDNSDGTDASCAAVNAAVRAGISICISTGNDGNTGWMASPGAADLAISIGASVDANTITRLDDVVADFSNEGPRLSDGDPDSTDEMKPDLCPPGAGITSVNGALTTDGTDYVTINGTSMSSPMAAGLCALICEACPGISPADVKRIVRDTAEHLKIGGKQAPGAAPDYQAIDGNYHPSWGWGFPDAYAAVMEARFPNRTQVVRESARPVTGGIDVAWTTQREVDLGGFQIFRADPLYGQRGPFQRITVDPIAPVGDAEIHRDDNRTDYSYPDRDPALVPGETYWYRVQWFDGNGLSHDEPAFPVIYDPPAPVATIYWSITHDTIDNDLLIYLGSGTDASEPFRTAEYVLPAPGTGAADSVITLPGDPTLGTQQYFWHLTLTDQDFGAAQFMPPGPNNPWFLWVNEAGFVNRAGRVNSFRIVHHAPGGDVIYDSPQPVTPTIETLTTTFWIPLDPMLALNHAPVIEPVGPREALEGRTLAFTVSGSDPDGDALTWSAPELPPGATFNPASRNFSWSPGYDAVASTTIFHATFRAEDATTSDEERIEIRLHDIDPNGDLPPYWTPTGDQSVLRGETLVFQVEAVDPEGSALTYSASGLPSGASFDAGSRTLTFATTSSHFGDYPITFKATDGTHPDVTDEVVVSIKTGVPPLIGACQDSSFTQNGSSAVGSADLGIADSDTVALVLAVPANRVEASLSWALGGGPDIDYVLEDEFGNVYDSGASTSNPETILVDNLPAGSYRFVVTGFLVATETPWTLQAQICLSPGISETREIARPPVAWQLAQNFPNPFAAPGTRIAFRLGDRAETRLRVFDVRGALVKTLIDGPVDAGDHLVDWDTTDSQGSAVASGIYFYRIEVPGRFVKTMRMVMVR